MPLYLRLYGHMIQKTRKLCYSKRSNQIHSFGHDHCLLVSLSDENDSMALGICLRPIERGKQALNGSIMTVTSEDNHKHKYNILIETKMMDEKLERSVKNWEGSGSSYNCTMCEYNRSVDTESYGPVPITRNDHMASDIGEELMYNASHGHLRKRYERICKRCEAWSPLYGYTPPHNMVQATVTWRPVHHVMSLDIQRYQKHPVSDTFTCQLYRTKIG